MEHTSYGSTSATKSIRLQTSVLYWLRDAPVRLNRALNSSSVRSGCAIRACALPTGLPQVTENVVVVDRAVRIASGISSRIDQRAQRPICSGFPVRCASLDMPPELKLHLEMFPGPLALKKLTTRPQGARRPRSTRGIPRRDAANPLASMASDAAWAVLRVPGCRGKLRITPGRRKSNAHGNPASQARAAPPRCAWETSAADVWSRSVAAGLVLWERARGIRRARALADPTGSSKSDRTRRCEAGEVLRRRNLG